MSTCRDCHAAIIWAEHKGTRRRAPINAEPEEGGNIVLRYDGGATTYTILSKKARETYQGGDAHVNHFATCPAAAERRQR